MQKLIKAAAALAIILVLPTAALAHNDEKGLNHDKDKGLKLGLKFHTLVNWQKQKPYTGTVTAVSPTGFTLKTADGKTFTVLTANASLTQAFGKKITLSDIHVNDKVWVKGTTSNTTSNTTITAKLVVVTPPNTHPAAAKGTVTAVNANTITLQTNYWGVPNTVTVKTDANTVFKQNGATTTQASVQVGSQIKTKGLWDEILNVLNAIKIKIK